MEREDPWEFDDWRRRRRRRPSEAGGVWARGRRPPRSGAVTSVAVLNFLAGPLLTIFAGCAGLVGLAANNFGEFVLLPELKFSPMMQTAIALLVFGWVIGCVMAAFGLLYRAGWARWVALMLGGLAMVAGILSLTVTIKMLTGAGDSGQAGSEIYLFRSVIQTVFFLGYHLWTYGALLNPRCLVDFR